jgi:hypothetical protein
MQSAQNTSDKMVGKYNVFHAMNIKPYSASFRILTHLDILKSENMVLGG